MPNDIRIIEIDTATDGNTGVIPAGATMLGAINLGTDTDPEPFISTSANYDLGKGLVPAGVPKSFPPGKATYPEIYYNSNGTRLLITAFY